MPNHCWNTLELVGPASAIGQFREHDLAFSHFHPPPTHLTNDSDLYDWYVENWGTKWEAWNFEEDVHSDEEVAKHHYRAKFTTAWGPPIAFLKYLVTTYTHTWAKLTWVTEDMSAGLFVVYQKDGSGELKTTTAQWAEPCFYGSNEDIPIIPDYPF